LSWQIADWIVLGSEKYGGMASIVYSFTVLALQSLQNNADFLFQFKGKSSRTYLLASYRITPAVTGTNVRFGSRTAMSAYGQKWSLDNSSIWFNYEEVHQPENIHEIAPIQINAKIP